MNWSAIEFDVRPTSIAGPSVSCRSLWADESIYAPSSIASEEVSVILSILSSTLQGNLVARGWISTTMPRKQPGLEMGQRSGMVWRPTPGR